MADFKDGLHLIPAHMHHSVTEWIETAPFPPSHMGSFLRAVLGNDFMGALAHADEENTKALQGWGLFLYNHAPAASYGSDERMSAWYERGGLGGQKRLVG